MLRPTVSALLLASTTLLGSACIQGYDSSAAPRTSGTGGKCKIVDLGNDTVTFTSNDDVAAYKERPKSGCWELQGTLVLDGSEITSLAALGDLRSVDNLTIQSTGLTHLDFASTVAVKSLGVTVLKNNKQLLDIAKLTIHRDATLGPGIGLDVEGNALITSLGSLESTTTLDQNLVIKSNPKLAAVTLSALTDLGDGSINISQNLALASVELSGLSGTMHDLYLVDDPKLATLAVPGVDTFGSVTIKTTGLTTLMGLAATGNLMGQLAVASNAKLTTLAPFNKIQNIYSFVDIRLNPALSTCEVAELDACVPSLTVTSMGNKTMTPCPKPWCQQ